MRSSLSLLVLFALLLTAGCAKDEGMELAAADKCEEIAWFQGDVTQAFELAKSERKPLFLYWGAVWCPPCNQIKNTIFTKREFIEKTKLFVPVYLDGDTESAQTWADRLEVSGYPSMLIMSPEGREVMRLPTGLQPEEFIRVLDEALDRIREARGQSLDGECVEALVDKLTPRTRTIPFAPQA